MAVGLPVIATAWGGPMDYIVHGETGILVPPDDPGSLTAGLAAAMTRIGEDPQLAQQFGAAGRARVEAHFDWDRKIDTVWDIYTDLAGVESTSVEARGR
jgi:glycogen(starch) synthase